jgi:hypothetical protein
MCRSPRTKILELECVLEATKKKVLAEKAIASLDRDVQDHLVAALNSMDRDKLHGNREVFGKLLKKTV